MPQTARRTLPFPTTPASLGTLLLVALLLSLPAHANGPAHGAATHASQPAIKPTPAPAPAAAPTAPSAATTLSLEQDAERITETLQAAMNRAATRQQAREHAVSIAARTPAGHASVRGSAHGSTDAATARHAAVQGHTEPHWSYLDPGTDPGAWARLKPEFQTCATGKRQSPVHIEESVTLQGPAEPLAFDYRPSGGSVVNNGHTIQVDLDGQNTLTVRGSTYRLLQFHFHHPAEEKVNHKGFAMVAHLVHQNAEGRLAVLAVLIDPGAASDLVHKVWTHMPLDVNDRVRLPADLLDLNALLPQDQRYYQFMGSLTTPPCTEGVLWMVLKQPMSVSREQLKLFAQLFPMNARPVQALNGRVVREAQ